VLATRAFALRRFARTDHGALLAAIVALLIAGVVAAFLLPPQDARRAFRRERGSLVAPPADSRFSDLLSAPVDPVALAVSVPAGEAPAPSPAPSPRTPLPRIPPPPPPPTGDDGLLPDLPIIPPPPPPLRETRAAELLWGTP
jgi:hypothetical protein